MKTTELRIGNLVLLDGEEMIITGITKDYVYFEGGFSMISFTDIKGIPLTEEWLLKFGWLWNEETKSYEKYPNGDARMHLAKRPVNGSYTMFNYVLKAQIAERIWYVHQLQNLFFALTGEELEIK